MDVNWCSPNFYYDTLEWINCFNALICCLFVYTNLCHWIWENIYLPLHAFFVVLTIKTSNSILIVRFVVYFFVFNIEVLILLLHLKISSYVYLNWNLKWTKEEPVFISLWIDVIIMCIYEYSRDRDHCERWERSEFWLMSMIWWFPPRDDASIVLWTYDLGRTVN